MGRDQAQKSHCRRTPRQALHKARARDHRGGEGGRRRHRSQPGTGPRGAEGARRIHAQGQHRAGHRQGHGRGRRRRHARDRAVRGLRPGRRGAAHRGGHRQPQPHRLGGPPHPHQGRRLAGRARLRLLPLRQARRGRRRRHSLWRGRPHGRHRRGRARHRAGRRRLRGAHRARRPRRRARGARRRRRRGRVLGAAPAAQDPRTRRRRARPGALRLIDALEEQDDVDVVHANFDVSADVLERVAG